MRRLLGRRRQRRRASDEDRVQETGPDIASSFEHDDWAERSTWSEAPASADSEAGPEREFAPFVPVEAGGYRSYGDEASEDLSPDRPHRRLRRGLLRLSLPRWARPRLGIEIRGGMLLVVSILIAAGIFGTLLAMGSLRDSVEGWWPLVIIGGALVWMLLSLAQRRVAPFLGAWALAGIGLSALMDTQEVAPAHETVLGIVLVAVGLGIAFRGFLLRQQAAA